MDQADDQGRITRLDFRLIVALGFLQGIAVFLLSEVRANDWLHEQTWLYVALWGCTLFLPPTAQWLIAHRRHKGYWLLLGFVALVAVTLGLHISSLETGSSSDTTGPALIVGGGLAWAVTISLAAAWFASAGGPRDYPSLFRLTCRTVLLPLGALLFTLIFTLLLFLWGALFDLIAVNFFKRLFERDWFAWPVRGIVFGVATAILLDRPGLIDGVRRALTAIASALLPVVVAIHLIFLVGLGIVGLAPLWATRHATPLILTLLFVFLIMLNGAHEEGGRRDRGLKPISGLTRLAILLSPIYIAIAGYSLALRVGQYGWSPDRVVSACIITFVGIAVLAYLVAALRRPFLTLPYLGGVNLVAMAALFILTLAVNSPILSPVRIAAASQEARILAGRIDLKKIDWETLGFGLGRHGREVVQRLAATPDSVTGAADIRSGAERVLAAKDRYDFVMENRGLAVLNFRMVPGDKPLPDDLIEALRGDLRWTVQSYCDTGCKLLAVDLNQDGETELVLLAGSLTVYGRLFGKWMNVGELAPAGVPKDRDKMIEKLGEGTARTVPSQWLDLEIDGERLQFKPAR